MSDYCYKKVVRCKVKAEDLGIESLWDLGEIYQDEFGQGSIGDFVVAPTEEEFVDYLLNSSYGCESSDYGRTRKLSEKELEKYIKLFSKIIPNVKPEDLRLVEYCWYNCCEAPGYFDEKDDFYNEV